METYRRAFQELKNIYEREFPDDPPLEINSWRLDFELNPVKIIRQIWPESEVFGCNFHFGQAIIKNWKLKCSCEAIYYDKKLIFDVRHVVKGMAFAPFAVAERALQDLQQVVIPSIEDGTVQTKMSDFVSYVENQWFKKRDIQADWNLHNLLVRGNTFFTSNQCESLHSALNRFYKTPPSTIRAASLTLNDYKKDFLMKFSNQFFNPRRADTMEKAELVLFHHHQIMAQPPEWRLENAMDICRQFTLYFAPILSPYPFSSSFDCYEPSSDFINL